MTKRTILIVDDQLINRRILSRILIHDYLILEAADGREAMECLHEHKADISAVLLDIVMPIMDGYEVLATMAEEPELAVIPVIVSSQKDGDEAELKALSLGAQDFIAKPYKADIIRHRISNTIKLRENAAMVNKVQKDQLTGLYNKQFFLSTMEKILSENKDNEYDLICIGIERFKLVNDTYGIHKGDEFLCHIASVLRDVSGDNDISGRFTADLFYLFTRHRSESLDEYIQDILDRIKTFPIAMNIKIHCGIYCITDRTVVAEIMCDRANLAAERNRGKYDKCFSMYDDKLRKKLFDEQFITSTMQTALVQEQFVVYYQPKYDLHTEMIAGAEALVRWIHPERGFLPPGEFIDIFEKNGFITQLDRFVWERVCKDLRSWIDRGYPPVAVSVNVSRADIYDPNLADVLINLVNKYSIPIPYLHLEITESAYTDNQAQIIETVSKLHDLGFIIEMDDFGSGYSSLNMLAELPVDVLKLDMKFIQNESSNKSGRGIMSFVISLAKWMRLSVVAEGVETSEQISSLRSMDCNYVQGYYFAKPMPENDFVKTLKSSAVSDIMQLRDSEGSQEVDNKIMSAKLEQTMLIVDDIEINRAVLAEIFNEEYNVIQKENGRQAWEYLDAHFSEIDIILMDLLMPVMDGFQLLERMRADSRMSGIPVIVTSQGDAATEQKALEMRADDFISKPYNADVVRHRVHNVALSYNLHNMQLSEINEVRQKERALLDSIPGGMAIYRIKTDGRAITEYVSEGVARMCGYSKEELLDCIRDDARCSVITEDRADLENAISNAILNNSAIHETCRMYTKGKHSVLVRMDANIAIGDQLADDDIAILYAVHTKVTEDSGNIIQEQMRYRYILDNLDVAFFEIDEFGNHYASDKYSLYAISDMDVDYIKDNSGMYSSVHPDDLPLLFDFFNLKNSKLPKVSTTLRMKMRDGSFRWTEMMGFFEYDNAGKLFKTIGVLKDVDQEWLRQNKRLHEALEAAELANSAKTDFLARVSHDMRTPLNGIMGVIAIMENNVQDPKIIEELEQLKQSGNYLTNLINDTLDVSKIESGIMELKPVICDGRVTFNNVINMVKPSIEAKNISFNLLVGDLPFTRLFIDVNRLEQAIVNILNNAIKFTPEGGTIELEIENMKVSEGVITDRIIIRDTGTGMSDEFQRHIFEPFSQEHNDSKSVYNGSGLGMTIAKQCVELMGGSISVKSQEGKGTEVTLIVPMNIATEEQIHDWKLTASSEEQVSMLKGRRILLCEDHPLNASIATKLLESKGMIVEQAVNGRVGVDMFEASSPRYYDAILMDIRMPEMDGLEATRTIRALKRLDAAEIPIVAMTANAFSSDVKNSINAGMSEHLGKPIEPDKLYRTLADLIFSPHPFVGKKVMVVDDIEMNRQLLKKAVSSVYRVIETSNGREALDMLKSDSEIVAVITDIQMPEMDGKALIRAIRLDRRFDCVAILANTIYGNHRQEDELLALGANDFVYKPSSPGVILMRLEHILRNI